MLVCLDGNRLHVLTDGDVQNITAYRMIGDRQYRQMECCVMPLTEDGAADFYRRVRQTGEEAECIAKTRAKDLAWAVKRNYISLIEGVRTHLRLHLGINQDEMHDVTETCMRAIELCSFGVPDALVVNIRGNRFTAANIVYQYGLDEFVIEKDEIRNKNSN